MSARLSALFLVALLGVVVVVGLALAPLGLAAVLVWVAAAGLGLGLLVRKARDLRAAARPAGRTCTCCTTSVHDPVKVI